MVSNQGGVFGLEPGVSLASRKQGFLCEEGSFGLDSGGGLWCIVVKVFGLEEQRLLW